MILAAHLPELRPGDRTLCYAGGIPKIARVERVSYGTVSESLVIIANGMRLEVSRDQKVMVKKNGRNYSVGARSIRVGDEVVQIVGGMVVRGKVTAIGTAFGQMTMAAVETDKGNLEVNGFVCQAS